MNVLTSKRSTFPHTLKAINKHYAAIDLQCFEFRMSLTLLRRHRASQSTPDTTADMGGQFSALSDVDLLQLNLNRNPHHYSWNSLAPSQLRNQGLKQRV